MGTISWADIQQERQQRLSSGTQTLRIVRVREYLNPKGKHCIELVLENSRGEEGRIRYSIEPQHIGFVDSFLGAFLHVSASKMAQQGGWQSLVVTEFQADVDYGYEGDRLRLMPVWD